MCAAATRSNLQNRLLGWLLRVLGDAYEPLLPDLESVRSRTVAGAVPLRGEEESQLRRPSLNLQIMRFFPSFTGRPRLA